MRWRAIAARVNATLGRLCGLCFIGLEGQQILSWGIVVLYTLPLLFICALLIGGSIAGFRRQTLAAPLLGAGWGCVFGMFTGTYLSGAIMEHIDPTWGDGSY